MKHTLITLFVILALVTTCSLTRAQTAITADNALISIAYEDFNGVFSNAASTIAMTLTWTGAGSAANITISAEGASLEVKVDGTSHADLKFPAANNGINLALYFASGKTFADLAAFIDSSDDFTCTLGTNMPPWINSATKLKVMTEAALTKNTAKSLPAGYLIAAKMPKNVRQTISAKGLKVYPTFGAGNTCSLELYEYDSGEGETLLAKFPQTTATAFQLKNDEFRVDATKAYDAYILMDYSSNAAPNAVDYLMATYSYLRR